MSALTPDPRRRDEALPQLNVGNVRTLEPLATPTKSERKRAANIGFFRDTVWSQRYLLLMLALELIAYGIISPIASILTTDFFASSAAGRVMHCEDYAPKLKPVACNEAASTAAMVKAIASGASALLGFFLSPVIGSLSDVYGRKPFLIFSEALNTLQLAGFLLFAFGYLSIWPYMVAQSVQTAFSSLSVGMAYIADGVSPQNRSAAFGMVLAVFSLGIIIGPLLGGFLPQNAALYLAGALGVAATLYAVFLLPESLPTELRKPYTPQRTSPIQGIKILFTTSLFRRLSLCVLFQTACGNGIQDVLIFYLQDQYNFGRKNISTALVLLGFSGIIVQGMLIKPLTSWLGHKGILILGLVSTALSQLQFAVFKGTIPVVYANITVLLSLGLVTFPAVSSIKSINVTPKEQGQIQGALYGLRQLAGGLGPVVFSTLYKQFDKRGGSLPYFPQAPFYFGVFLLIISIGFAISLPNPVKDLGKEQARFIARRRACSIPTYLPSTPRTPVRTFMPRRASTGLYGRNLKFAPDGSQSGSGAASNFEDSLSAASPLLTRTPQGDSAAFARDVDSAVDDVLDRRARRGEVYGRSHSPVSAGERARSGSRDGLLPPTVHRQRTAP